jgi:hypothetical protein
MLSKVTIKESIQITSIISATLQLMLSGKEVIETKSKRGFQARIIFCQNRRIPITYMFGCRGTTE